MGVREREKGGKEKEDIKRGERERVEGKTFVCWLNGLSLQAVSSWCPSFCIAVTLNAGSGSTLSLLASVGCFTALCV